VRFRNSAYDRALVEDLALQVAIHIGLVILLAAACILILRPFVPLVLRGIIIAVAVYPVFQKLQRLFGARELLPALLVTILLLVFLAVPVFFLAKALVEGLQTLAAHFKDGTLKLPPPSARLESWPIIGAPGAAVCFCGNWPHAAAISSFYCGGWCPAGKCAGGL
jgi:predicted PurR-regulated permease PerM